MSWRRAAAIGMALCLIGAGAFFLIRRHRDEEARMRLAIAYRDLEVCLYGAPLPATEIGHAGLRREAVELCRDTRFVARSPGCRREVKAFETAWSGFPRESVTGVTRVEVKRSLDTLAGVVKKPPPDGELPVEDTPLPPDASPWDVLAGAMRDAQLPTVAATTDLYCTELRPAVVRDGAATLAHADLRPPLGSTSTQGDGDAPPEQEYVQGSELRLLWRTRDAGLACWLPATGGAEARCGSRKLDDSRDIVDSSDGLRDVIVANRSGPEDSNGVRGEEYVSMLTSAEPLRSKDRAPYSAWAHADGSVSTLDWRLQAIIGLAAGVGPTVAPVPHDIPPWHRLVPGWALRMKEQDYGQPPAVDIFALPLDETGTPNGLPIGLGTVAGRSILVGCRRADNATTLAWLSQEYREVRVSVAYSKNPTELSPLVNTRVPLAANDFDVGDAWTSGFGCSAAGDPRWTFVDRDGALHEIWCKRTGCKADEATAKGRRFRPGMVVPIGDRDILEIEHRSFAFPAATERRILLTARRAKLHDLDATPPQILLAEPERGRVAHGQGGESAAPKWKGFRPHSRGEVGWVTGTVGDDLVAIRLRAGEAAELVRPPAR